MPKPAANLAQELPVLMLIARIRLIEPEHIAHIAIAQPMRVRDMLDLLLHVGHEVQEAGVAHEQAR